MIKKTLLFVFVCLIVITSDPRAVFADSAGAATVKTLSLDEAIRLALDHYSDLKLSNWKVAENDAHLSYITSVKKKLEDKNVTAASSLLSVSFNDFLKSIPNYDQLSDEDKAGVQQSITLQIMINTSINQWIQAQTVSQNSYNQELKNSQLLEYSDQLRSLESNQTLSRLEIQKSEALVRYDTIQKYYQLCSSQMNIEYQQKDKQYLDTQADDALVLYNAGLLPKKDLEAAQVKAQQQETAIERNLGSLKAQKELFKQELGLSAFSEIIFSPPALPAIPKPGSFSTVIKIEDSLELKEQDAKVKLAQDNYDAVLPSEIELKNYYHVLWSSQLEQRTILQQQLELKLTGYKSEANDLCQRNVQLLEDYSRIEQALKDIRTLNSMGLASLAEVDKTVQQLNQSNQQMDSLKYEYLIFLEKVNLAVKGVVI
ncbi:hypothetical protein PAECIP111892_03207 [Paenibacillus auburnensis]|uniref:TolC family protein n=1 Tax=Paenibacillus auburnensis TaxID=2905649 RepID=A0ABN8GL30_9BACL|nr:hypothetical protein [Paenibacillus auburnensis]CAH1209392.1 hypothetical protein PAECIP111892_03207 [Paenibacillus auburnensis]